ncbi:MAG: transposase [Nitrospira sp.]|nr:transposase [Nitrospira sp.]
MQLAFIRLGKPVENGLIESFTRRLRDECLNVEVFWTLDDARETLPQWLAADNLRRPQDALKEQAPATFAAERAMTNDPTDHVGCVRLNADVRWLIPTPWRMQNQALLRTHVFSLLHSFFK